MINMSLRTAAGGESEGEVTTVDPDEEKLLYAVKVFTSRRKRAVAMEKNKVEMTIDELKEALGRIQILENQVTDLNNRLKGAETLRKENEGLKKYVTDLTSNLEATNAKNSQLETSLRDEISSLEQENEKLLEYQQKVRLVQHIICNHPIKDMMVDPHTASCCVSGSSNLETGAATGTSTSHGVGTTTKRKGDTKAPVAAKRGK